MLISLNEGLLVTEDVGLRTVESLIICTGLAELGVCSPPFSFWPNSCFHRKETHTSQSKGNLSVFLQAGQLSRIHICSSL